MRVGVALKPGTPVDCIYPLCEKVDMVLVMTVEPGTALSLLYPPAAAFTVYQL